VTDLHQEGEDVSSLSTAKAVKDLFLFIDHEGGSLLRMKRTKSLVVLPCLLEIDVV